MNPHQPLGNRKSPQPIRKACPKKMTSVSEKLFHETAEPATSSENKVSVVGAGQVGMACVFSILTQDVSSDVAIVDLMPDKLQGEMMDMQHGAYFMHSPKITANTSYEVTANSKICIVTAGARQREGESRLDLVQRNADIFKRIIPELVKYSPNTVLLIVSNPVDILTYLAWKISGLPRHRVIGSGTNLDSSRFRFLLSQQLGISVKSVHGYIIGEHGDSSVAVWSGVNVAGVTIRDLDPDFGTSQSEHRYDLIHKKVIDSAYEIIKLKGYTSWAIGLSVSQLCSTILGNISGIHCVTVPVQGLYGIEEDVFLSIPSVLGEIGVSSIIKLPLNDDELHKLRESAKRMSEIIKGINI